MTFPLLLVEGPFIQKTILVKVPGLMYGNAVVRETTADALIDSLFYNIDPEERVDDRFYYSRLVEKCLDGKAIWDHLTDLEGEPKFIRSPLSAMDDYCRLVHGNLCAIMDLNKDTINLLYATMIIKEVEVLREFNESLLLLIKGKWYESYP